LAGRKGKICGYLGTGKETAEMLYYTRLEKNESTEIKSYQDTLIYQSLPFFQVKVTSKKTLITLPSEISCIKGGLSLPLILTTASSPFTNVTVSLKITNSSSNISALNNTNSFSFTQGVKNGFLQFECKEGVKSGIFLNYSLSGVNKEEFKLSSESVKVSVIEGSY